MNIVIVLPAQHDIAAQGNAGSGMNDFQRQRAHEREQKVNIDRSDNPVSVHILVAEHQPDVDENEHQCIGDAYDILQNEE